MDRAELRAEIARKNLSKTFIAEALDLSLTSLNLKLKGEREFKESEIQRLVEIFGWTAADINRIFLS